MKTREQIYGQEAAGILRDVAMYRALTKEQIMGLYPGKQSKVENLLTYMVHQGRICRCGEYYCPDEQSGENIDNGLLAAVWVLIDMIDQVEYHSSGDFPAKIIFFAEGEVYEIVYAEPGKEALINHVLSSPGDEPSKYLILVDKVEQIKELNCPNIAGFCMVSPGGQVQYYKKE